MKNLFLFLLLFSISVQAQVDVHFGRTYTDTLPEKFKVDAADLRTHIRGTIPADWEDIKYRRPLMQFSDQSAIELSSILSGGSIYSDWEAYEDYINDIVEILKPKELENDPYLHIYLRKRASTNAAMSLSGMGFMNIGLVDLMEDEATLAGILAHELAHYYLKHSVESFIKAQRGEFSPSLFSKKKGVASQFSIKNELEADSLAMIWMLEAGYDVDGLKKAFAINEREHENYLARRKNKWEVKETTHPSSERRIEAIDNFIREMFQLKERVLW
ncbi:MAG: putative Zn-dependent protease [Saprospiraceae bacterium]|jgi:predicted Zn-dependent protease